MKSLEISKNTMSSLEIADLSGMIHKNVLRAIKTMEPSWVKAYDKINPDGCGRNFELTSREVEQPNGGFRKENVYELTKAQSLFVATKFNDEARALLVLRWEQLENANLAIQNGMGIQIRNRQATISTRSISVTTGILHDELIRLIKTYLHEHTEVLNEKRYPRKGHLRKGKFLIENIWELYIHNNKGVPQKEYILTRDGFNYLVKWYGFLAFSGFLPHYSREFEILTHQEHIKALE